MVSTILAHDLLDVSDHSFYLNTMMKKDRESDGGECGKHATNPTGFEMKSRKAWTDLLLQVVKVKVDRTTRNTFSFFEIFVLCAKNKACSKDFLDINSRLSFLFQNFSMHQACKSTISSCLQSCTHNFH